MHLVLDIRLVTSANHIKTLPDCYHIMVVAAESVSPNKTTLFSDTNYIDYILL